MVIRNREYYIFIPPFLALFPITLFLRFSHRIGKNFPIIQPLLIELLLPRTERLSFCWSVRISASSSIFVAPLSLVEEKGVR